LVIKTLNNACRNRALFVIKHPSIKLLLAHHFLA
jgi:hypothetical protein